MSRLVMQIKNVCMISVVPRRIFFDDSKVQARIRSRAWILMIYLERCLSRGDSRPNLQIFLEQPWAEVWAAVEGEVEATP